VTLRPSFDSLLEISEDCPQQKLVALHNLEAQGFGSAPVDVEAYNKAHWWTHVLESTYHDYFLYEVSKGSLGGFNLEDDDDESLFTKAHQDQTCRPVYGQTCEPLEVMAYSDSFSVNPFQTMRTYYGEPFFTHYPPVFLANTAVVIFQAFHDDPANFEKFFNPATLGLWEYNIGNSKSIMWQWMHSLQACDFGKKYSVKHWTFSTTQYYRAIPSTTVQYCNQYMDFFVSDNFIGNYYWAMDYSPTFWQPSESTVTWDIFSRHPAQPTCWSNVVDEANCHCSLPWYHPCNCTATEGW